MADLRKQIDMANGTCSECGRVGKLTRIWCGRCYQRWRKYGDPGFTLIIYDDEARFWSKVDKRGPAGCWLWTDPPDKDGYGSFNIGNKHVRVHRWAYEHFVKPIPDGMTIDHLCHSRERQSCHGGLSCLHRRCVNPAHLEPVTNPENVRRSVRTAQTYCKWGHEFTPENTYITPQGRRWCRACDRERRVAPEPGSAAGGWKKKLGGGPPVRGSDGRFRRKERPAA